ncbi:MAG: hypothetical protein K2X34_10620, partial [Hyphomonadaceae bacterium]|nr:hypothetical protein [Hyphomonadaceae bacterium]
AAEAPVVRRPVVPPRAAEPAREPAPQPVRTPAYEEPRPSFANDIEPERRPKSGGGGFSMFGWKKPEQRDEEPQLSDFNVDDDIPPPARQDDQAPRDPSLDEELEIPAFLRRQMNPR